ncbi:Hsp20/alpha crystallin family protein [Methylocystis hirsuta]|uniref:Hsp20/alpha crystallin family protein n=1 Tax=Methylocystis hirsuta TaxID=369798 RepID=A0A3M9XIZ4_9HYPH|nr:Hsp20/alpha crystallin family protein [Methylocystis hirsuta]RNJ48127.1 Hsp20/alpha crystallin family protein [Methylocystis hirsuta]
MAEKETKLPVKKETGLEWHPFETLRRQINRLFEEFPAPASVSAFEPFDRLLSGFPATPAVDFVEKEKEYEITAELPGMDDKSVEVKLSNGTLTIGGEKKEEKEEKKEGYYFSERRYGSFKRAFRLPEGVDADKIEASFDKGVLTVRLPKTPEAQKAQKTIEIKTK